MLARNFIWHNKDVAEKEQKPRYRNLFLGVELPEEYLPEYRALLSKIKKILPQASLSTTEFPHITLLFLGDVEEDELDEIYTIVQGNIYLIDQEDIKIGKLDHLRKNFPRVVYLDVDLDPQVDTFCRELVIVLKQKKNLPSRKFHPHLTLCRLNSRETAHEFLRNKEMLENLGEKYSWQFPLRKISIIARDRQEKHQQKVLRRISL